MSRQLHVQVGESADGFINHGSQHVELLMAEQLGPEDALHVPGSEAAGGGEGDRRAGGGAELELEGVQEGVDDGSLEGQSSRDDGNDESEERGEERRDELGEDDGGEHDHEDGDEVGELAQVQSVILCGHITSLVIPVVVGGTGLPIASTGRSVRVILLA